MKKNIAIIRTFALVAALIISGCGGGFGGNGTGGGKANSPIQKKIDEIIKAWENATKFDKTLYESQMDDVHRWENNKMFKHTECETLRGTIREYAIQTAYNNYDSALVNWTDSSETIMNQSFDGLQKVKKDFGIQTNAKIAEVEQIHALYTEAVGFVRGDIEIYPNFSGRNHSWTSFNTKKKAYTDKAENMKTAKYFSRISHVPEISQGLVQNLNSKLESKRDGYYRSLVKQITDYFNGLKPLSQENYNDLNFIYRRLDLETSYYMSNLAEFIENNKPAN